MDAQIATGRSPRVEGSQRIALVVMEHLPEAVRCSL
jgi:hypothetical protein